MIAVKPGVERKVVMPAGVTEWTAPYSPGIMAGNTLFTAGMVGRKRGAPAAEIKGLLAEEGMDFTNVVRGLVWVTDIRDFQSMNEIYREFLPSPAPARATVGAPLMSSSALVEIMMVAVEH